jgi:hypothetical protein
MDASSGKDKKWRRKTERIKDDDDEDNDYLDDDDDDDVDYDNINYLDE